MTPAFGFSVGDFISTINLIKKVSKALKASGGASHEYQHVIIELKGLEAVLQHLEALDPTEDNIDHVNAIRGMALACQLPLRDFLTKLETFEKSMSPFTDRTSFRGVHQKAKWAVSISEEVDKLRTLTAAKVVSINLLLATHASQTLSRMEARGRTEHQSLMTEILKQQRDVLRTNEKLQEIKSQASDAGADLTQRVTVMSDTVFDIQNSVQSIQSTGQRVLAFLRTFPAEMREMLRAITQTDLRIYTLLLQIHRDIANKPTNLLETNIRFEDALGRRRELPYEYFRHWEPFEGFLQAEFRNMPGEGKVANGQYRIMDSKRPDQLVTKDAWDRTVFPGAQLTMTMVLSFIKRQAGLCPRLKCSGVIVEDSSNAHVCSHCGLKLYIIIPSLEDNFGRVSVEEEEEQIEKRQVQEDVEMFGSRLVPVDIEQANDTMIVDEPTNKRKRPAQSDFPSASTSQKRQRQKMVTAMDWNSGATPIDAWLNQSAIPAQSISTSIPDPEQALQEEKARDREQDDLQTFRKVHVHSATDVPDTSAAALELDEGLEFGARLYYRNIVDRFPVIPRYLARRLAEVNLVRGKRLASSKSKSGPETHSAPGRRDDEKEHHGRAERHGYNDIERDLKVNQLQSNMSSIQLYPPWSPQKPPTWPSPPAKVEFQGNAAEEASKDSKPKDGPKEVLENRESPTTFQKKQYEAVSRSVVNPDGLYPPFRSMEKCADCRRRKKPCRPMGRTWPDDGKCLGCISAGLECGPYTKPRTESASLQHNDQQSTEPTDSMSVTQTQWNEIRYTFERHYIQNKKPLKEVMRIMHSQYGFRASRRQYHSQIAKWGLKKYNANPPADSESFWTGGSPRRRSASVHSGFSSMNSSLRGDQMNIDPSDQSPTFQERPFSPSLRDYSGLPPPPVELGKTTQFECDICGELIRVKRRREWQAHVFSDLSPYICTFPDCNPSGRTFTSRRAFAEHEVRVHNRNLKHRCGACGAISEPGPQALSHQFVCRLGPGSSHAPYAPNTLGFVCLFCGQWVEMERLENEITNWDIEMKGWGNAIATWDNERKRCKNVEYVRHVGQHMEQIAFAVVTKPYEDWDFYTDLSSEKAAAIAAENGSGIAFFAP